MALPFFIKYIYNSGTDEVIRRGKKIYSQRFVELVDNDELTHSVTFRVKDDSYSTFYKVQIQKYDEPKAFTIHCSCPYNISDICRHEVATLMQLQDLIDKNLLESGNTAAVFNQKHTVVKIKFIDLKMIRMLTGMQNYTEAEEILRKNKCNIIKAADERVEADLEVDGNTFHIILQKNEERNFERSSFSIFPINSFSSLSNSPCTTSTETKGNNFSLPLNTRVRCLATVNGLETGAENLGLSSTSVAMASSGTGLFTGAEILRIDGSITFKKGLPSL